MKYVNETQMSVKSQLAFFLLEMSFDLTLFVVPE
jgi:hypothetical protein